MSNYQFWMIFLSVIGIGITLFQQNKSIKADHDKAYAELKDSQNRSYAELKADHSSLLERVNTLTERIMDVLKELGELKGIITERQG